MKLNRIKLKNIRSYIEQEIEFPEKTTLLAGDVGSGKSSILLAIDFALFGLQRGSLSGSSLLRNGTNSGCVQLEFEIDNIPIIIKRTLKRESTITQDSGYIIINNVRQDLTPQELKQKILELLNYPQELLTKSKSLIYRYTVYTPQEEMKQILLEDTESRLNTLRRVFGIDKYKTIKENSNIFINHLKQSSKESEGQISDLNEIKKEHEQKSKEIQKIKSNIESLKPKLEEFQFSVQSKKQLIQKIESDLKNLQLLRNKFNLQELNIKNKKDQINKIQINIENLELQIKNLKSKTKKPKTIDENKLKEYENTNRSYETIIKELNSKITESDIKIQTSKEIIEKITLIDICPLCQQKVTPEHVKEVKDKESKQIEELTITLENSKKQLKEFELKSQSNKNILESLKQELNLQEIIKLQIKNIEEKETQMSSLEKEISSIKEEIKSLEIETKTTKKEIDNFRDLEKNYSKEKELLENLQNRLKLVEIEHFGHEKELIVIQLQFNNLEKEIQEKEETRKKLAKQKLLLSWLQEHFLNLVSVIEKKIMFKVHNDFNSLFQKWFDLIIDNELLNIKLDEEFTPLIEQAGHELDYEYLSGGEKTATALAYRLSLNQVINTLISAIKTKDLLILDEPTDGFSSEQLDRIKLVLDQLDAKQIIIVSHESKIESFVDNIIKLSKKEHVTEIIK